jgi:hypothetical protein
MKAVTTALVALSASLMLAACAKKEEAAPAPEAMAPEATAPEAMAPAAAEPAADAAAPAADAAAPANTEDAGQSGGDKVKP